MKIYFRNPKTSAIRERVCSKENVATVTKEEYIIGYTEIWQEIGADIEKIHLTETAYFEGHTLFIKNNWSSTKNVEEFAPAAEFTDFKTEKSTHELNGKFFYFPKAEIPGHKYGFVKAFEEYGKIKFNEIAK